MKANGTDVIQLVQFLNRFKSSNFVNGCPAACKDFPTDARFAPQIKVRMQSNKQGSNCTAALKYEYERWIAKKEKTDKKFYHAPGKPAK